MSSSDDIRDRSRVQAVERALDLLVALSARGSEGAHITELAASCGLKPSTCHRLLGTMAVKGFVSRNPGSSKYLIGSVASSLAGGQRSTDRISEVKFLMRPFMEELSSRTQEVVNVAILDGSDVLFIDQIESLIRPPVRMFARAGSRGPAYCTGSGKALLAGAEDEVVARILHELSFTKFTSETIDDAAKLRLELHKIRADGYSLDMGERDVGVRCVAAPVRGRAGRVVCAISVAGPSSRLSSFYLHHELIALVCDAARRASECLRANPSLADATSGVSALL